MSLLGGFENPVVEDWLPGAPLKGKSYSGFPVAVRRSHIR
jgi:hypothetical protein